MIKAKLKLLFQVGQAKAQLEVGDVVDILTFTACGDVKDAKVGVVLVAECLRVAKLGVNAVR